MTNGLGAPLPDYLLNAVVDRTNGAVAPPATGGGALTGKLEGDLRSTLHAYVANFSLLLDYVRDNDPEGWAALWEGLGDAHEPSVERAVEAYRRAFRNGYNAFLQGAPPPPPTNR